MSQLVFLKFVVTLNSIRVNIRSGIRTNTQISLVIEKKNLILHSN